MPTQQAAALAALLTFSSPHLAIASTLPTDSLFSVDDIASPTDDAAADTYNPDIYSVGDIFPEQDVAQDQAQTVGAPDFLKDIFLGPSDNRQIHPSTLKIFSVLGKAQKGLETYKAAKGVFDAIGGKDADGVIGGVRSILSMYGLIDPNSAVVAAATNTIVRNTTAAGQQAKTLSDVAFAGQPQTPRQWYVKSKNNAAVSADAAQSSADFFTSPEGIKVLEAQDQITQDSVTSANQTMADAGLSSATSRQLSFSIGEYGQSASDSAGQAQADKSSQKVLKRNAEILALTAAQNVGLSNQVSELNDNQARTLGTLAQMMALEAVQNDKMTMSQALEAGQLSQLTNVESELRIWNESVVDRDLAEIRKSAGKMGRVYFGLGSLESQPTTTAQGE